MIKSIKWVLAVSLVFASFGQIASDLYVPSLPNIAVDLHTSRELVQLTVTTFMLSYSIARLFYGPLSDGIGRRPPLLIGFSLTLVGSAICLFATSVYVMLFGRLIQGFGAASGSVLTAAILRDLLEGKKLARFNSYLAFVNIIFIASPPLLGGYLEALWGWRSTFTFLFIYTLLILILIALFFPETNKNKNIEQIKTKKIAFNIKTLLSSRLFMGYGVLVMFGYASGIAWLTSGAIIIQQELHYSPIAFGWLALAAGLAYSAGAIINAKIVMTMRSKTLILFGSTLIFLSGIFVMTVLLLGIFNIYVVIFPVFIFYFGSSFIFPSSYSGAMMPFPDKAGSASAVLSSMQILGGVLGSAAVALLPFKSFTELGLILLICGIISLLVVYFTTRRYRVRLYLLFFGKKLHN